MVGINILLKTYPIVCYISVNNNNNMTHELFCDLPSVVGNVAVEFSIKSLNSGTLTD